MDLVAHVSFLGPEKGGGGTGSYYTHHVKPRILPSCDDEYGIQMPGFDTD